MIKYYYSDGSVSDYRDYFRTLHRLDGPAIEYHGDEFWYQNGLLHRVGEPATVGQGGDKCYYQNDLLHRLDGPAAEFSNGEKYWYINGKQLSEEEFEKHILIMKLSGVLNG